MPKGPASKESKEPKEAKPEELDFETALGRLEAIVAELESGQLGLEESLSRFEQAMALRGLCSRKLREAEARVEEYTARAEAASEAEELASEDDEAGDEDAADATEDEDGADDPAEMDEHADGGLFDDL